VHTHGSTPAHLWGSGGTAQPKRHWPVYWCEA